jgi:pimeloyl-ACP methyl ester carboxylesterase
MKGAHPVQCAELQVPIDYENPEGERLLIAINRIVASPGAEPRGVLLYNPGGPGGQGKSGARDRAARGDFDAIAPGFDVIGFDPRGVGESSSLDCPFINDYYAGEAGEVSPEEAMMRTVSEYGVDGMIEDMAWLADQCRSYWGGLFDHLGSNQVVRDIDAIRVALGVEKLNFYGASYGTRLGALYAQVFPDNVRAVVLDAAVPPQADIVRQVRGQFEQLPILHEAVLADCEAGRLVCPAGPGAVFDQMLADADALGIAPQLLGVWELGLAFSQPLLVSMLQAQVDYAPTDWMYNALTMTEGEDDSFVQNLSVNCADNTVRLLDIPAVDSLIADAIDRSPLFARSIGGVASCNGWSVAADPVPLLTAPGAPPILVVGGTRDQRTPYEWSVELAESLQSGVLLTSEHWGHCIVGNGTACVDGIVSAYLTNLELPEDGTVCSE